METLTLTFSGDTPASVAVTALTRTDTGDTVPGITLPAAMTLSNGSWVVDFTPPAAGLVYAYTFVATWSDGTTTPGNATHVGAPGSADTYYVNDSRVRRTAGQSNYDADFNLDNNALTADPTIVQEVYEDNDAYVDQRAYELGLTPDPAATPPHYIATTDTVFTWLSIWASRRARTDGRFLRGAINDNTDQPTGQMQKMRDEAEKHIDSILSAKAAQTTEVSGGIDGISVIGPATNGACCGLGVFP